MNRIALVAGCVWSLCSWAQNAFVFSLPSDTTQTSYSFGPAQCGDTLTVAWSYAQPVSGTPNDSFQIWASAASTCGQLPSAGDQVIDTVSWPIVASARAGTLAVHLADLPIFDGGACGTSTSTIPARICGSMPYFDGSSSQYATGNWSIIYDPEPPPTPAISAAVGKDRAIEVTFIPAWRLDFVSQDAKVVALEVRAPDAADFQRVASVDATGSTVSAENLTNGVEYHVRLIGIDAAGNESVPSRELTATPSAPQTDAGVPDDGDDQKRGCSTAPGLFVALATLWLRRRKVS